MTAQLTMFALPTPEPPPPKVRVYDWTWGSYPLTRDYKSSAGLLDRMCEPKPGVIVAIEADREAIGGRVREVYYWSVTGLGTGYRSGEATTFNGAEMAAREVVGL